MSLIANYQDLDFASHYAVDKIVGIYTDSFDAATQTTVIGGYIYQFAIPHPFTRPVFCELLWSTDGINYFDGGQAGGIAYSDAVNIYVATGESTGTIYYKVIASWIDDYDTTNPLITPVLNTTNTLYFDSRNNYEKIYHQDVQTLTGDFGTLSYIHGLNFSPNYKVFFESISGQVWPVIAGGTNDFFLYDVSTQYECEATINSTLLTMNLTGGIGSVSCRVWYRIYLNS
jgi:hypothetical protein